MPPFVFFSKSIFQSDTNTRNLIFIFFIHVYFIVIAVAICGGENKDQYR